MEPQTPTQTPPTQTPPAPEAPAPSDPAPPPSTPSAPGGGDMKKWLMWGGIAVVVLIILYVLFL